MDWITKPITVIHGSRIWLVPVKNAFFIEKQASNSVVEMNIYDKAGHLISFTKPEIIKTPLLRIINDGNTQN